MAENYNRSNNNDDSGDFFDSVKAFISLTTGGSNFKRLIKTTIEGFSNNTYFFLFVISIAGVATIGSIYFLIALIDFFKSYYIDFPYQAIHVVTAVSSVILIGWCVYDFIESFIICVYKKIKGK